MHVIDTAQLSQIAGGKSTIRPPQMEPFQPPSPPQPEPWHPPQVPPILPFPWIR
ncbi:MULTISPECIES: hypothetical protein [unclassified Lysobacter]|uniref:hypothetical protein n=1 Tax=unclassified Lysobacter TaxID=2635362 RepID=UPI001BED2C74|nr:MULTISPECIES: hypothetical protein [unclassified Lysobacter]MBT2750229.1 hypothetical protein [Lysobacter sp. ISL-50]MBT2775200.1 hypothetical protein [Lysobacter sp. ISL-54]MBT2782573.1 hypothetical protein [Lysobacter sp. ISL-52]